MSEEKQENTAQQGADKAASTAQPAESGKASGNPAEASKGAQPGQNQKKSGGTSSARRRRKRGKSSRKGRASGASAGQNKNGQQAGPKPEKQPEPKPEAPADAGASAAAETADKTPAAEKTTLSAEELRKEEARRAAAKQSEQDRERASQPKNSQPPETPPAWPVEGAEEPTPAEPGPTEEQPSDEETAAPDEAQQARVAEISRTVQVSVEQILAGAEQAANSADDDGDSGDSDGGEDAFTVADRASDVGRSLVRWLVLVFGAILIIAVVGVGWLYCNATDEDLPQITVSFDGQTVETASYSWHVPVVGNSLKRTYSETYHRDPVELSDTVDTSSPLLTVSPSGYKMTLTITDENDEEVFSGTPNDYRKFSFPSNGTYTAKLVISTETGSSQNAAITGEQTYLFQFTVGIRPTVRLNTRTVAQGGIASVRVSNLQSDEAPTISGTLSSTEFVQLGDAWWAFVPVPYDQTVGGYVLQVTADGYSENLELSVTAANFGYSDVSSNRQRVTPYLGEEDIPAQVKALFDTADPELYWAESGFVQPFLRTIDVKLAYGAPEYVGRTRTERTGEIDNGTGRVAENVVVNTRWGDTIISPADGRVLLAGDLGGTAGNTIVIEHGGGVKTIFYGLGSIGVKAGDKVKQGAEIGTTVRTTIVEVRVGDVAVEPLSVLRGESGALQVG